MKRRLRFAAYRRVSTERQEDEGTSLDVQLTQISRAVENMGGTLVADYAGQESGMEGQPRPQFERLLRDVPLGHFDAVIVANFSRWGRTPSVEIANSTILLTNDIRLFELEREHQLDDPSSEMTRIVLLAAQQYAVKQNRKAGNEGRIELAKRGFPSSGSAPWGRILVNPDDKIAGGGVMARWKNDSDVETSVRRIAKWRLRKAYTWEQIASKLTTDDGFRKLYWGAWQGMNAHKGRARKHLPKASHLANSIRRHLLEDCGPTWTQTFDRTRGKRRMPESKWTNVNFAVPPLLPANTLAALQRDAASKMAAKAPKHEYLLSRICRCGPCGSVLNAHTHTHDSNGREYGRPIRYFAHHPSTRKQGCVTRIRVEQIEVPLVDELSRLLGSTQELAAAIRRAIVGAGAEIDALNDAAADTERALKQQVAQIEAHADAIGLAKRAGAAAEQAWSEAWHRMEREKDALEDRRRDLVQQIRTLDAPADLEERVQRVIDAVMKPGRLPFSRLPHETQRKLIQWLFDARGSLKNRKDIGVYIYPATIDGTGTFRWQAKGIFGAVSGAWDYVDADVGLEPSTDRTAWKLQPRDVAALADIAVELPLTQRPRPRYLRRKKGGGDNGSTGGAGNDSSGDAGKHSTTERLACVYPREVVKIGLLRNAAAMIFAHNHPSGVPEPSRADELLTQSLKQALALVEVRVLDHFIVAGAHVTSFAERGLI